MEIYKNPKGTDQIKSEAGQSWTVKELTFFNGVEIHIEGAEFTYKGMATPEAIWACNIIKRAAIELTGLMARYKMITLILILHCNTTFLNKLAEIFSKIGNKVMSPVLLKDEYLTPFAQEFKYLINNFLKELKINNPDVSELITHLFEYDSAYRFRLQDLFAETSVEKLLNPKKELKRLIEINRSRDEKDVSNRFSKVGKVLQLIFLSGKIKRAFIHAIQKTDIKKLQPDDSDMFWMCQRTDYNFMGLSFEARQEFCHRKGWKIPNKQDVK